MKMIPSATQRRWFKRALLLTSVAGLSRLVPAATAPYYDNFDGYSDGSAPSNFVTTINGPFPAAQDSYWRISNPSGTDGKYVNVVEGYSASSSAGLAITNLASSDFQLSTTFVLGTPFTSSPLNQGQAGLAALSTGPDFTNNGYRLSYQVYGPGAGATGSYNNGRLILYGLTTGFTINAPGILPVVFGTSYTMVLSGAYSAAGLSLTGTLTDGTQTVSLSASDPSPRSGTYFGYYDNIGGSTQHSTAMFVTYDDFSLTIPEPATTTMLIFAGTALIVARRRFRGDLRN